MKKLRLRGIHNYAETNLYLPAYWEDHNRRYARAAEGGDCHRRRPTLR